MSLDFALISILFFFFGGGIGKVCLLMVPKAQNHFFKAERFLQDIAFVVQYAQ